MGFRVIGRGSETLRILKGATPCPPGPPVERLDLSSSELPNIFVGEGGGCYQQLLLINEFYTMVEDAARPRGGGFVERQGQSGPSF